MGIVSDSVTREARAGRPSLTRKEDGRFAKTQSMQKGFPVPKPKESAGTGRKDATQTTSMAGVSHSGHCLAGQTDFAGSWVGSLSGK